MASARVSPFVKRAAVIGVAAAVAVVGWKMCSSPSSTPKATTPPAVPSAIAPAQAPARIDKVTRLESPAQRAQLAERIRAARDARSAPAATGAAISSRPIPRLPATDEPALGKTEIRAAMRELIPSITECYEAALPTLKSPNLSIVASLTLTGDADIGTVVDAHALNDDAGQPLPAGLDDCLRSTFQLMALPPLAEGDRLEVNYPFVFRNAGP